MDTDVIVIGSGLGGLSAASLLARGGCKVAVFERHNQAGGYATTFQRRRGDFLFDVSLHGMGGLAPGGLVRRNLEMCGVWDRVRFTAPEVQYRCIFPEHDFRVPQGDLDAYLELLAGFFPSERAGLRSLIGEMTAAYAQYAEAQATLFAGVMEDIRRYPDLLRNSRGSQEDLLRRHLQDPVCRAVFSSRWYYHGTPPSKLPAMTFIATWGEYMIGGSHYPIGTCQALVDAFVEVIVENGGSIHLRRGVRRILVEGGKATGVELDDGERLEARTVIANSSPYHAVFELAGAAHFPEAYLKRLRGLKPSLGSFAVYLGLDCDIRDEFGMEDYEIVHTPTYDLEELYRKCRRNDIADSEMSMVFHGNLGAGPEKAKGLGQANLSSLCAVDPWQGMDKAGYRRAKEALMERYVARLEDFLPGVRKHILWKEASTPLTNIRYTGNPEGAIYGFEKDVSQFGKARTMSRTPIENLYFSSSWVFPGGGYSGAIWAGYFCVFENGLLPASLAGSAGWEGSGPYGAKTELGGDGNLERSAKNG